ncbi:hypothetical protein L4D00_14960 [Photobacterium swingsii]|uniref:hypothetical protein n=1 Tax=Photobacterium swingsii TaxID=680026 RepID=UPI003D0E9833
MNYIAPFTDDAKAYRDGLQLQFTYNQNVQKKKDLKVASDFLPYLNKNQEWFEHKTVTKAKTYISMCKSPEMLATTLTAINEEIEVEESKLKPDSYLITKLRELINNHKDA